MNIIAYGSLMNRASLEMTLGRPAKLTKITVPGWTRVFNAPFDGYAFLNLKRDPNSIIEAAYFDMSETELALFAKRESGSVLLEVIPSHYAFVWPRENCQDLPVLQSYVSICNAGALQLQIDLLQGMRWPQRVVNDVREPLYR